MRKYLATLTILALSLAMIITGLHITKATSTTTYDINTLAGKNASVNGQPGLYIQLSGYLQTEAQTIEPVITSTSAVTPTYVPNSNLDGQTIQSPDVTVNQDTAGAPQNEPAIAVDPNNANRIVTAANDYVGGTWSCSIGSTPCSAFGDGYSGTYFSNDGGATWCCTSSSPQNLGTLIPGVEHLTGGPYDAGGDPSLAFDNTGHVYYAGLGFDRTAAPNTVTVSRGTFDSSGTLHWSNPTFLGATNSPSVLNDKEWIGVDSHASSPFNGRVYVSWTRFLFNAHTGGYIQSPIIFAYSTDNGQTFSTPQLIGSNVLYDQGSHIVVSPNGSVYVFFEGSTRLATLNSIYMVKSMDGGATWSSPIAISKVVDILNPANTAFRVNSFPMADIANDGTLYTVFSSEALNTASSYTVDSTCAYFIAGVASVYANCHAASYWSKSTDGGNTWTTPSLIFPALDASNRTPIGYPQTNPDGTILTAPAPRRVDTFFPSVATASNGHVYMSAYAADVVSPWLRCTHYNSSVDCATTDNYQNNARLDYAVTDLTTGVSNIVTTHPVNSRYQFRGGFIGDYTTIAVGSDNKFHTVWTDTNNVQTIVWWFGTQYVPTSEHQQEIATASGTF